MPCAPAQPDEYQTLGQFYKAVEQGELIKPYVFSSDSTNVVGLSFLDKSGSLFNPATASAQFGPGPDAVFTPEVPDAGGLVSVINLPSALLALTIIVHQGEGNPGPFDDPSKREKDHYDIFVDLQARPQTWDVFPVMTDPTTAAYFDLDKKIYAVGLIPKLLSNDFPDQLVTGFAHGRRLFLLPPLNSRETLDRQFGNRSTEPHR